MGKCIKITMLILAAAALLALLAAFSHEENPETHRICTLESAQYTALTEALTLSAAPPAGTECRVYNQDVPFDAGSRTFYVPVSRELSDLSAALTWHGFGETAYLCPDALLSDLPGTMAKGHAFTLLIEDGNLRREAYVVLTSLPVVNIQTEGVLELIDNGEDNAHFSLLRAGETYDSFKSHITFRPRGRSSVNKPKQSFRVSLYQSNGRRRSESLLGMGKNREWVLLALYDDYARVRDKVSLELWNDLCSDRGAEAQKTQSMEYVEVLIDNEYRGLYGLLTTITGESLALGADESLYKVIRYPMHYQAIAGTRDLLEYEHVAETEWPKNAPLAEGYRPLSLYADAIFTDDAPYSYEELCNILDVDSVIDRSLMLAAASAWDNELRNNFLVVRTRGGALKSAYLIPYDLTMSWGRPDTQEAAALLQADDARLHDKVFRFDLERLLAMNPADCRARINARYAVLRNGLLSKEALTARFEKEMDLLQTSGAFGRDAARWTEYPLNDDLLPIKRFIEKRLMYLDEYFESDAAPYS